MKKQITYLQVISYLEIKEKKLDNQNKTLRREGSYEVHELDRVRAILKTMKSIGPAYYNAIQQGVTTVKADQKQIAALAELSAAYEKCAALGICEHAI